MSSCVWQVQSTTMSWLCAVNDLAQCSTRKCESSIIYIYSCRKRTQQSAFLNARNLLLLFKRERSKGHSEATPPSIRGKVILFTYPSVSSPSSPSPTSTISSNIRYFSTPASFGKWTINTIAPPITAAITAHQNAPSSALSYALTTCLL